MAEPLNFLNGVTKLHAFYTEQVRMLAHAYDMTDEEAATVLDNFGYHNVARAILHPPAPGTQPEVTDERTTS